MTAYEIWTIVLGAFGVVSTQVVPVMTFIQARRAAAQGFENAGRIKDVHMLVDGQTSKLIETSNVLALAQGNREGRAESTLELAAAEKIVLDNEETRKS